MKKSILSATVAAMVLTTASLYSDDVIMFNEGDNKLWSQGNWAYDPPIPDDVVVWNNTITGNHTTEFNFTSFMLAHDGTDFILGGMSFTNSADMTEFGARTQKIIGTDVIQLGASGITMSTTGTKALPYTAIIDSPIKLMAAQTWKISGTNYYGTGATAVQDTIAGTSGGRLDVANLDANGQSLTFEGNGYITFTNVQNLNGFTHSMQGAGLVDGIPNGGFVRFQTGTDFGTADITFTSGNSVTGYKGGGVEFYGGGTQVLKNDLYFNGGTKFLYSRDSSVTLDGDIFISHNGTAEVGLTVGGTRSEWNPTGGDDGMGDFETVNNVLTINGTTTLNANGGTKFQMTWGETAVFNGKIVDAEGSAGTSLSFSHHADYSGNPTNANRSRVELLAENEYKGNTYFGGNVYVVASNKDSFGKGDAVYFSYPNALEVTNPGVEFSQGLFLGANGTGFQMSNHFYGSNDITFNGASGVNGGGVSPSITSNLTDGAKLTFGSSFTFASASQGLGIGGSAAHVVFKGPVGGVSGGGETSGGISFNSGGGTLELLGNNTFKGGVSFGAAGTSNLILGTATSLGDGGRLTVGGWYIDNLKVNVTTLGTKAFTFNNQVWIGNTGRNTEIAFFGANDVTFLKGYANTGGGAANGHATITNNLAQGKKLTFEGFEVSTGASAGGLAANFGGTGTTVINGNMTSTLVEIMDGEEGTGVFGNRHTDWVSLGGSTTLVINGTATYSGGTSVAANTTLVLNGEIAGNYNNAGIWTVGDVTVAGNGTLIVGTEGKTRGNVILAQNATLAGSGTVGANFSLNANNVYIHGQGLTFTAGLTTANRTFRYGAGDLVKIASEFTLAGTLAVNLEGDKWQFGDDKSMLLFDLSDKGASLAGLSLDILENGGTISAVTLNLLGMAPEDYAAYLAALLPDGENAALLSEALYLRYDIGSEDADGNFIGRGIYLMGAVAIPEPNTWLLLGAGAAFVAIFRRRRAN